MSKVLVVDDQDAVRTALKILLELADLDVLTAATPDEALVLVRSEDVGVIIQDMNFSQDQTSGREGGELFRALRALDPDLPVLLMTAWASLESAVALIKEGAADYFTKPWDDGKLVRTVQNLLQLRRLHDENLRLRAQTRRAREELATRYDLRGVVVASPQLQQVVALAVQVAGSDVPVLITGPNGSGKEKIAEIVQANSRRKAGPFVKVNAGALPDDLLEAELFGAEPGAYTGSTKVRVGRFEAAHGGTLFLDEIANLSAAGQAKLLRVLQTGEFERLGSSQTRKADFRLLSATNADLRAMIRAGTFREDLYFRLNVIELRVPPLAERPDDILPLAEQLLAGETGGGAAPLSLGSAARAALLAHDWPGNVRELQNRIARARVVTRHGQVEPSDLGLDAASLTAEAQRAAPAAPAHEREDLEAALDRAHGVVSRAAAELGLSRQALYRRMERHGISIERRARR
ncbi:MAG TPA: sigma-54 dependent transcriptional regulator [Anaeromyxobacteraceae bacterium]|nr:sigma-54 dependent transcriptional regulator [Anaeromyxobacteraceae bacterium]